MTIIKYKNSSNTWRTYLGVDIIALSIIRKIYYDYQETGEYQKLSVILNKSYF